MNAPAKFEARPATRQEEPLLLGMVGPPGGGKTLSSLRIAKGIQSVRGGPIIVIDTEGGRSRKYADQIPFEIVEFAPPCRPERFLDAIRDQLARKPAAIIVDSASDEHEGEGGYLEWHDEMIPKMGGNEWAAWAKPKASRKRLINGILHIKTPLIFTFRAREKTKQDGKKVINIGWQPVAPLEIVHTLDLTCILPPRADGVPVWRSDKIGEDFIIKLPSYLRPYITEGKALSEEMGRGLAQWAKGGATGTATAAPAGEATASPSLDAGGLPGDEDSIFDLARKKAETLGRKEFLAWYRELSDDDQAKIDSIHDDLNQRMEAARS
ncbi:AAA family ATPase [Reyranella sp.]|uniref:AAA family ATPase n=1 Tax=Reyranella sp. TaxID=1929291 RepID=UPI003D11184B